VRILAAVALAAGLGFTAIAAADQPSGTVASYATAGAPAAVAAGPNGNPWFVEPSALKVGTVAAGTVSEFGPTFLRPVDITSAPGDTLWVLEENSDIAGLWRTTTAGAFTATTGLFRAASAIATDSAGDVWVTYPFGNSIGEVKPPYTEQTDPDFDSLSSGAGSIAEGPDGATMWFTEQSAQKVGSIGQTGSVKEYSLPTGVSGTIGNIVLGSDGNLWVGVAGTSTSWLVRTIGSGSSEGATTAFALPSGSKANVDVLASGPDNRLWMADGTTGTGDLTAVTTAGAFTDYPHALASGSSITSIAADPGGADALWMTNATATTVQRVPLAPPPSTPPPPPPAPPVLTTSLGAATAITTTSATVSGTISEPAGSPATSATYQFQYGTDTTYGTSTAPATATVTPAGTSVSATLSGLEPYTTYHYRLLADDCSAAACQVSSADQTFTTGSTLAPSEGTNAGAKPVSGTVLIQLPHHHGFVRLRSGELVPLGATIDARHGTVLIVSSTGPGEQASGVFAGGVFEITQPAGGTVIVLVLQSSFKACLVAAPRLAPMARAAAKSPSHKKRRKHKPSKKTVNQVFGNAHGQFATQGQYATAADQGTSWQVADRCDGTLVTVTVGQVSVTDRQHHRTFVVNAGHHVIVHHR